MKKTIIEKIKDFHFRICLAILSLSSIFIFIAGIAQPETCQKIPALAYLLIGWAGLVVSVKMSEIIYK